MYGHGKEKSDGPSNNNSAPSVTVPQPQSPNSTDRGDSPSVFPDPATDAPISPTWNPTPKPHHAPPSQFTHHPIHAPKSRSRTPEAPGNRYGPRRGTERNGRGRGRATRSGRWAGGGGGAEAADPRPRGSRAAGRRHGAGRDGTNRIGAARRGAGRSIARRFQREERSSPARSRWQSVPEFGASPHRRLPDPRRRSRPEALPLQDRGTKIPAEARSPSHDALECHPSHRETRSTRPARNSHLTHKGADQRRARSIRWAHEAGLTAITGESATLLSLTPTDAPRTATSTQFSPPLWLLVVHRPRASMPSPIPRASVPRGASTRRL